MPPALYVSANDINRQITEWRGRRQPALGRAGPEEVDPGPEEEAA